jgi:hypothetical protein
MKLTKLFLEATDPQLLTQWWEGLKYIRHQISKRFKGYRTIIKQLQFEDPELVKNAFNNFMEITTPLIVYVLSGSLKNLPQTAPPELEFHVDDQFSRENMAVEVKIFPDGVESELAMPQEIKDYLVHIVNRQKASLYDALDL